MADAEWADVRKMLPVPAWLDGRGGRPESHCHRQMVDAVRYLVDNGIKWRAMPADLPPRDRVYAFCRRWRDNASATLSRPSIAARIDSIRHLTSSTTNQTAPACLDSADITPDLRRHTRQIRKSNGFSNMRQSRT
ncbi:transposase [Streptomyces hydrogenans]|uniref:transposase n=1 Tax=Streptomyces hydrogenans TaxID=1873719 RepID=UPI0035E0B3CD